MYSVICKNKKELVEQINTFGGVLFYDLNSKRSYHRYSNDLHVGESIFCTNSLDKWSAKVTRTENGWNIE